MLKLFYFDVPARAFPIRAALRHGKVPFEDVRVSREMFMELKGKDGYSEAVPLSQLPVLQLPSGETVCQSLAILKYAGKLSKLYPEDPSEALIVDEAIESIMELYNNAPNHADADTKKKMREEWIQVKGPKYFSALERKIKRRGGPFLMGKSFTIADLVLYRITSSFLEGNVDFVPGDFVKQWPLVMALREAAIAHPIVKEELTHYPQAKN